MTVPSNGHFLSNKQTIMWLGSSIGNFDRKSATEFLQKLLRPGDHLLIGMDGCSDRQKIETAYNDDTKITEGFIFNGLNHASELLGGDWLASNRFDYVNRWNEVLGAHEVSLADFSWLAKLICEPCFQRLLCGLKSKLSFPVMLPKAPTSSSRREN